MIMVARVGFYLEPEFFVQRVAVFIAFFGLNIDAPASMSERIVAHEGEQILADAQIEARGFVESLAGTTSSGDAMRITRPGFRLEENFPQPATPPSLGQNTRGWLLILGLQPAEIDKLAADGVIALGKTTSTETA